MKAFQIIVYILGAIAILTGISDFWQEAVNQASFGDLQGMEKNPTLNFTVRFFAAIWAGFGVFLCLFAWDLKKYKLALILAFVIVMIGGIGRIMSMVQFGITEGNETHSYLITGLEVVLIPILLVWLLNMNISDEPQQDSEPAED